MASSVISQFNEILSSFLIQIVPIVGSTYYNNIQKIIKYNNSLPIENFLYYAIEYRDKILTRDETYICNEQVIIDGMVREDKLDEVFQLKNIYIYLDQTSKDNVWDILQALLILGEDYIKIKYGKEYEKNWIYHPKGTL